MAIDSSIHVWFNYVQDRCPSRQLWGQRWWPQSPHLPNSLSVSGLEWERAHAILTVLPFSSIAWDWQKHCLVIVDWQGVQICHNVGPLEKNRSANEMQIGRYKWAKEEKPLDLKLQKKKIIPTIIFAPTYRCRVFLACYSWWIHISVWLFVCSTNQHCEERGDVSAHCCSANNSSLYLFTRQYEIQCNLIPR